MLKQSYNKKVENFIRSYINYIIKPDFFVCFHTTFFVTFDEKNIRANFRGTGLIPFNPETMISKLDIKLYTPISTGPPLTEANLWIFKILQNLQKVISQSDYIKTRIIRHQGNFPTSIYKAIDQMVKNIQSVIYKIVLMQDRIYIFKEVNRTINKRYKIKKTRI